MSETMILNLMMLAPLVLHLVGLTIAIMVDPSKVAFFPTKSVVQGMVFLLCIF